MTLRAAALAFGLAALSAAAVYHGRGFFERLPFGPDRYFWLEATALYGRGEIERAVVVGRPPLYPALAGGLVWAGVPLTRATDLVSMLATLLLSPLLGLAVSRISGLAAGFVAGVFCLLDPRVVGAGLLTNSLSLSLLTTGLGIALWPLALAAIRGKAALGHAAHAGLWVGLGLSSKEPGLPVLGLALLSLAPAVYLAPRRSLAAKGAALALAGMLAGAAPLLYQAGLELGRGATPKYLIPLVDPAGGASPGLAGLAEAASPAMWVGGILGIAALSWTKAGVQRGQPDDAAPTSNALWPTAAWLAANLGVASVAVVSTKHMPYHQVAVTPVLAAATAGLATMPGAGRLMAVGVLGLVALGPVTMPKVAGTEDHAFAKVMAMLQAAQPQCILSNHTVFGVLLRIPTERPGPTQLQTGCHVVLDGEFPAVRQSFRQAWGSPLLSAGHLSVWAPKDR